MTRFNLFAQLKGKSPAASDLRDALGQIDVAAAERALDDLAAARARILVEGTDEELVAVEEKLARAARDRDRAVATKAELEARLTAAEHAEAEAALDAKIAATEKRAEVAAANLRKALEVHGAPIAAALAEAAASADEISALDRSLGGAGRPYPVSMATRLDRLFWPGKINTPNSVLATTSLPPVGKSPGWGAALEGHRIMYGQPPEVLATHSAIFGMPAGPARGY